MKDKKMTVEERFRQLKIDAKAQETSNVMFVLSCTKRTQTELTKKLNKFLNDLNIDSELGILSQKEIENDVKVYTIIKKTLENCITY